MSWWILAAFAGPTFDETVCNEPRTGPPKGARAIAASALPWALEQRRRVSVDAAAPPGPEVARWLRVDLAAPPPGTLSLGIQAAKDPTGVGGWLVVEARAPVRAALTPVNVTIAVDVAGSMDSVVTRSLPVLQSTPATHAFPPVTRLQLTQAGLRTLIRELPEGSRLSLVAIDGASAQVVLEPTDDKLRMSTHVDLLAPGLVAGEVGSIEATLQAVGSRTFAPCDDNRALMFTSHVEDLPRQRLLASVARWAAPDVQRWTFAVGVDEAIDPALALSGTEAQTARWIVNSIADFDVLAPALFDAGGIAASDVEFEVRFPAGATWTELASGSQGAGSDRRGPLELLSGEGWSATYRVEGPLEGASLHARTGGWSGEAALPALPELVASTPGLRTRVAALTGDPAWVPLLPVRGQGTEVGAWIRPPGPRPEPPFAVTGGWIEPTPEGSDVVLEFLLGPVYRPDPTELRLDTAPMRAADAWVRDDRSLRVLWSLPAPVSTVRVEHPDLAGTDPVWLDPLRRGALLVRATRAQRDGSTWEPSQPTDDPRIHMLLAQAAWSRDDVPAALRWSAGCTQDLVDDVALGCAQVQTSALVAEQRLDEADALLTSALERHPHDARLALPRGQIAHARGDLDAAESWYVRALAGGHDRAVVHVLGALLEARGFAGIEALLWSYHLLHEPSDIAARTRLLMLLNQDRWKKLPDSRGSFAEITLLKASTPRDRLVALMGAWSQAHRRSTRIDRRVGYAPISEVFSAIERGEASRGATVRILVPPEQVPPEEAAGVIRINDLLR